VGTREAWQALLAKLEVNRSKTIQTLGEEKAFHMLDVHECALSELRAAVEACYGPGELASSLLYAHIPSLLAELAWAQLAFLSANYPSAFRCLRFSLELACRSRLVDLAYPSGPVEKKLVKAAVLEKKRKLPKGWALVKKALGALRDFELEREERLRLRRAWRTMNKHAHPSFAVGSGAQGAPWQPWSFDENLAQAVLTVSDAVYDAILLLLLDAFPKARGRVTALLQARGWGEHLPMTYRYLRNPV